MPPQGEFRSSSKNFIVGAHPHGVFSFAGVCAAVQASGGLEARGDFSCERDRGRLSRHRVSWIDTKGLIGDEWMNMDEHH